jgi:FdhD protein
MISTRKTLATFRHAEEKGKQHFRIKKVSGQLEQSVSDPVIKEAPLEISVAYGEINDRKKEVLSVTMRTPGDDFNMVRGFLFNEKLIRHSADIISMRFTGNFEDEALQENALLVELAPQVHVDFSSRKNFLSHSGCGFCGRAGFDATAAEGSFIPFSNEPQISVDILYRLPALLHNSQGLFAETGGSHAVALLNFKGELLRTFEDVGRHNAMDKLVGSMLKADAIPLSNRIALFSGRLSYELVQKGLMAGIPILCALGAPTSLALELARDYDITVVGFLKNNQLNIYCGSERILSASNM